MNIYGKFESIGVVPVIKLEDISLSEKLATTLTEGNLPAAEITFRAQHADKAISKMLKSCPDMLVGAGTVLTVSQAKSAHNAGARFIVMPGFSADIVEYCLTHEIPVIPGCTTASEIMQAMKYDLKVLKFFPAESFGGLKTILSLSGPFPDIRFMPTGGINLTNLSDYLQNEKIIACGGTYIANEKNLHSKGFDIILNHCKQTAAIVKNIRG